MKAQVHSAVLLGVLDCVGPVVKPRATLPILGCVRVEVGAGALALHATNLSTWITRRVGAAEDSTPGCVVAGGVAVLRNLLAGLNEPVTVGAPVEVGRVGIRLDGDGWGYTFNDPIDVGGVTVWPKSPDLGDAPAVDLDGFTCATVAQAIERALHSISADDGRPNIQCVCLDYDGDGHLTATGTNGTFLCIATVDAAWPTAGRVLIMGSEARHLAASLARAYDGARVTVGERHIRVESPAETLIANTEDYGYPDVKVVVPRRPHPRAIVANRESLIAALRRVRLVTGGRAHQRITCDVEGLRMTLSGYGDLDGGINGAETIALAAHAVDGAHPAALQIGFTVDLLLTCVEQTPGDEVRLEMDAPIEPVVLRAPIDPRVFHVLMPARF